MADLTLSIQAQDKASPVLRGVGKSAEEMGRKLDGAGESGKKGGESIFGGVLKADLAMKALSKAADILVDTLKQGFDGLVQQEQADLRLSATLKRLGYDTSALLPALKAQAEAVERNTLLQGEQVEGLQELLLSYGVAPLRIKETTDAIVDTAAAMNKDATTAARTLMQAMAQGGEEISVYGVKVKRTGDNVADLNALTDAMSARFGGTAKAAAGGMAGSLDKLSKSQEDLSKALADFFVKTGIAGSVIETATSALHGLTGAIQEYQRGRAIIAVVDAKKEMESAQEELDKLQQKIATFNKEGVFFSEDDRRQSFAPMLAQEQALLERVQKAKTRYEELNGAFEEGEKKSSDVITQGASEVAKAIAAGTEKEAKEIRRSTVRLEEESKRYIDTLKGMMLSASADDVQKMAEDNAKAFQAEMDAQVDAILAAKQARDKALADAISPRPGRIGQLSTAGPASAFTKAFTADSKAHEDEMRQAGMALGQAFLSGLDEQLTQVESGGDMDMAALLAAIVPAAVTMAVITASGGAAAPYAPLIGAAAGMVVKHGLAASKGGGRTRYHSGGMVDDRPRFHGGGGLASDEVEAVLQTGEQVFSRGDVARAGGPRAVEAMRKGAGQVNVYVSTTDAQSFSKYMGDRGGSGLARTVDENAGEFAQRMRRLARRGS